MYRGTLTGGFRNCQMEGCRGKRLGVRWDDGKLTFPCTHGMLIATSRKQTIYKIL
jgi:hypothetical protein